MRVRAYEGLAQRIIRSTSEPTRSRLTCESRNHQNLHLEEDLVVARHGKPAHLVGEGLMHLAGAGGRQEVGAHGEVQAAREPVERRPGKEEVSTQEEGRGGHLGGGVALLAYRMARSTRRGSSRRVVRAGRGVRIKRPSMSASPRPLKSSTRPVLML